MEKKPSEIVQIRCNNTKLDNVNSTKLLDVIFNKNLTWTFHIVKTTKSIIHNSTLLRRIRIYLPHQTQITFYKSYIKPHIDYCNTVLGQSPYVNRIHSSENGNETRHKCSEPHTCCPTFFNNVGVMSIQNRVTFGTVTTIYKFLNGITPVYMKNVLEKVSNISKRSTCLSTTNSLYVPKHNFCLSVRVLHYSGASLYCTLKTHPPNHRAFKHVMWTCMFSIIWSCFYLSDYNTMHLWTLPIRGPCGK